MSRGEFQLRMGLTQKGCQIRTPRYHTGVSRCGVPMILGLSVSTNLSMRIRRNVVHETSEHLAFTRPPNP